MEKKKAASSLGSIKTDKKAKSSAENGKKGGRPKKTYTVYEIPRESRIKAVTSHVPEGKKRLKKLGDFIIFHRTDGMFSYCTVEGKPEHVCHIHVLQPLTLNRKGYYEFYNG